MTLWFLRLMVVAVCLDHVAIVTTFEGHLVIGRDDDYFDEKVAEVQTKLQKERILMVREKRRRLLEELKRDNISVELDSEDTQKEMETDPPPNFGDDIHEKLHKKIPLPTIASQEIHNPDLSRDIRKLYRSIESMDRKNDSHLAAELDMSKESSGKESSSGTTKKPKFVFEVFDSKLPSEENRRKLESIDAKDILEEEGRRWSAQSQRGEEVDKLPIFRSDYLDSFMIREGKPSKSDSEPEDPSIYDFEQPTEDPIEKYGRVNLDLVKLFSLEKNDTARAIFLNNSAKIKQQKRMYLRASVNTTLVDLDRFKLPRSDESMMDNMVTYNDPMPEPDNQDKREKILADYFSGDSSSRGDSHMNTFEFYDELRRVDFDFTKNKKLLAIFERRTIRNETISRIIDEKMNAKLEEKAEAEEKEEEKEKRRLKKKTTKSRLDALIEDIERMSTRSRKVDLPVTKIPWRSGRKTASEELRRELEQINEAKNKVVGRKRKAKGKTNKTGSVKKKTAKSKFKLVKVNTNVDDAHEHFQKILNKYTLPEVTRADHIPGSDEIPITGELFTLKDYDLKDFGFNMDGETNQTQVQSKIIYKSEMAGELEEKELRAENVEGKRQKRHVENISKNNENINKHKIDDKYNSKHHKNNMTTLETKSGFHGNKSSVHHGLKDFGFANNETEKNGEKEHDQNNGEDKNKSKMVINFLQNIIQNSKKIKKNSENQTNTDDKSISFENDPNIKHYEIDDADLKKFGMEFDENDPNKVMVSRILYESELSEETKKEMKADNEKMEQILQKYTKKINNIAVRKRFKYTRKNAAGNLGLLDEKQLRAQYNESDDDIPGSVSVISVEYDANVLNRIMEHNRDIAKNFRQNNRDLGNIIDTHQCQKTGPCRCIGTNENITEGFELEVENVHFTTIKKQMSNNLQKGTNRESKADSEESDSAFKAMNKMADHNLNPAAMFQSFDSDQRDESFYKDDDEKTNTTGGVPSHEMLDLSKMNDSEIESFILRKEAATRQANLLRDLIVTTASTGRVYKTRRTYNRRILVNCTGYVGDLRFKLLIPKKLKRTQDRVYVTQYPRYNLYWYYSMWPNYAKLLDQHTKRIRNSTGSTKYPRTMKTIYFTKKSTTLLIDRILNNLYNSTKYAKTKYAKPSFNSDIVFEDDDIDNGKEGRRNETTVETTIDRTTWTGKKRKSKKIDGPKKRSRLHYVKTKLEILENNDLIDNRNWGMVVYASNFTRGEYNVEDYAEYLGLDPKDFFNGETPPFKVEPMPVFEHGKGHDMFDNQTDFTYLEYEMTTDPSFTFDPVYHDNVEELQVMRKPTRTTFDPTAMNEWNYRRFYTLTSTRRCDRETTDIYVWTERTFRARFRDEGPTEFAPVFTCHQCPARFLNNEETDGANLLMRHYVKHQNLNELYYPIMWRFERNKTRWYNSRVRKYFLRLLREQDQGLSAQAHS
ncbi:hypothetical protein M8J75_003335 [Diaphorina citri]|nr:hypothetical protein M8J75_003335 [Diaphorina citri]